MKSTNESFVQLVRGLERQMFPEFKDKSSYDEISQELPGYRYTYFAPSSHISKGLLNRRLIDDTIGNRREILSVGAGKAYLKRFLVDGLGISIDQIVLADKYPVMPEGFKQFVFNMYGVWPDFGQRFDYVIFPESVALELIMLNPSMDAERLCISIP